MKVQVQEWEKLGFEFQSSKKNEFDPSLLIIIVFEYTFLIFIQITVIYYKWWSWEFLINL